LNLIKPKDMQKRIYSLLLAGVFLASCGSTSKKDDSGDLNDKKAQLEKLKKQQQDLNAKIASLQKEVASQDTTQSEAAAKLVAITPVQNARLYTLCGLTGTH
jgi:membrane fusion protein (multidrug efflux system)